MFYNTDSKLLFMKYITIDIWFSSPRDVSKKLLKYHHHAKKLGQVDTAMIALQMGWRYLLYSGGENLSIMLQSTEERVELIVSTKSKVIFAGMSSVSFPLFQNPIKFMFIFSVGQKQ